MGGADGFVSAGGVAQAMESENSVGCLLLQQAVGELSRQELGCDWHTCYAAALGEMEDQAAWLPELVLSHHIDIAATVDRCRTALVVPQAWC